MKYLFILLILIPSFLSAQNNKVELVEERVGEKIILKGVNHFEDEVVNMVVEITSIGFGLKKLETVYKKIPAGQTVEMITLTPVSTGMSSYKADFSYSTKGKSKTRTVEQKVTTKQQSKADAAEKIADEEKSTDSIVNESGIVLYSKEGCGRCEYVSNYFTTNNIPFTELNISTDKTASDNMSKALFANGFEGGTFTTPVLTVDGEVFYNIKDIKAFAQEIGENLKR